MQCLRSRLPQDAGSRSRCGGRVVGEVKLVYQELAAVPAVKYATWTGFASEEIVNGGEDSGGDDDDKDDHDKDDYDKDEM